jgi:hypothetical protein
MVKWCTTLARQWSVFSGRSETLDPKRMEDDDRNSVRTELDSEVLS